LSANLVNEPKDVPYLRGDESSGKRLVHCYLVVTAVARVQRVCDKKWTTESGDFEVNRRFAQSIGLTRPVLALSIARMADAMGNSILFIILPLYVAKIPTEYLHFPLPILVGILLGLYGLVNSVLQPLMGALSDRLGRRKALILIGLGLMCVGTIGFIPATNFLELVSLRMLQGIGVAITIPASMAIMAVVTEQKTRGGAMGVYSTLRVTGFAVGPLVGGFVKVTWGFNAAFFVGAGFIAAAMVSVYFWVDEVRVPPKSLHARPFKILDRELMHPGILSAAAATFIMAIAFSMVTTLENEFNTRLDISALGFGIAFSSLMVGRLLFQVPLGHLSDSVGRKPIIILGLLFLAPITGLLGEVTTLWQFIFLRVLQGIASAAIAAPAFAVAADLSQAGGEARQMSLITLGFGLGLALGPMIAGVLVIVFFDLPFLTGGVMAIAGAWIVHRHMPETVQGAGIFFKKQS
jgi:MFS family permease